MYLRWGSRACPAPNNQVQFCVLWCHFYGRHRVCYIILVPGSLAQSGEHRKNENPWSGRKCSATHRECSNLRDILIYIYIYIFIYIYIYIYKYIYIYIYQNISEIWAFPVCRGTLTTTSRIFVFPMFSWLS